MEAPTLENIMHLGFGFWSSKATLSAIELGVFTELATGPADRSTLQDRLKLHPRSAADFLDTLVALKLLERSDGIYRNSTDADFFLDRAKSSYIGGILEMANSRLYGFWGALTQALQTGEMQNESKHQSDFFATLYAEPERLRSFLRAMSGISAGAARAIADKFDWSKYRTFADVGAAQGMVPTVIARAHPHLKAIGFDLPAVQPVFEEFVAQQGLSNRIRFQSGNFFEDPIPTVDVIIMGHILHDWNLEEKKLLLSKAFNALPSEGALIVYDAIIDDERRENAFGLLMSLNMLIETPGGFDYTGSDCQAWMREAGFVKPRVEPLVGPDSMVVAYKP